MLIPAASLVNGATIVKAERITEDLTYWHVELDSPDVLVVLFATASQAASASSSPFQKQRRDAILSRCDDRGAQMRGTGIWPGGCERGVWRRPAAGAVAFSRTGDPATGEFEDAFVLRESGEVPSIEDLLRAG